MNWALLNTITKRWASITRQELKSSMLSKNLNKGEGKLKNSLSYSLMQNYGVVEGVKFQFAKQGVFVEKGVGRGYPLSSGKVTSVLKGKRRVAKPWYGDIINKNIQKLADDLQKNIANDFVKEIKIRN